MKYVIELVKLNPDAVGMLNVMVMSESINHSDVPRHPRGIIVSAGFCSVDEQGVHVYGKSTSLEIGTHPSDPTVLGLFFTNQFEQQRMLLSDFYEPPA